MAFKLIGDAELDVMVFGACKLRTDLFVVSADGKVAKLRDAGLYSPDFDPTAIPVTEQPGDGDGEFAIYVTDWDVGPKGSGPYRAVIHRTNCRFFENRVHAKTGIGYKNRWLGPMRGLKTAIDEAAGLHPWRRCDVCINKRG
ncbi:MAG: hypothetical protein IPK87_00745 [Planctomycetes bacterium]|nr:hypothetical protein [Planctomycetota bacterium]